MPYLAAQKHCEWNKRYRDANKAEISARRKAKRKADPSVKAREAARLEAWRAAHPRLYAKKKKANNAAATAKLRSCRPNRILLGICTRPTCKRQAAPGRKTCQYHLDAIKRYSDSDRKQRNTKLGYCRCGRVPRPGRRTCRKCITRASEYQIAKRSIAVHATLAALSMEESALGHKV